ncbi:MAG: AsmA-like C-terminal domain-containing protein [Rhodobacterales bacterium]|nr:AsmA-like C-terminal domain-containing protein [Rhodobacterales bacterium]
MIKRTLRGLVQILAGLGAGLVIVAAVLAWHLSSGPISLAFLTPHIQDFLGRYHDTFRFEMDDTILTWAGWERALDVRVVNVRAVDPEGRVIANVPELSVWLSAEALVHGLIAPRRIEFFRPRLNLRLDEKGQVAVALGDSEDASADLARRFLTNLSGPPDPTNAMSYLDTFRIIDADLTVRDDLTRLAWRAPGTRVEMVRSARGLEGEANMTVRHGGQAADVTLVGSYDTATERVDVGVTFAELVPADFAAALPEMPGVDTIRLPVQGTVTLTLDGQGQVEAVGYDVEGGAGVLRLPPPLDQDLALTSIAFRGQYDGLRDLLTINDLTAELGPEGHLALPAPTSHDLPLRSVSARGKVWIGRHRAILDSLTADLGGPTAHLTATLESAAGQAGGDLTVQATGSLRGVPVNRMATYWPRAWGSDAHRWCVTHLADGTFDEITAQVGLVRAADGDVRVGSLSGTMAVRGVTVDYLPPMPKARGANGRIRFDRESFNIATKGGRVAGLEVTDGLIKLLKVDTEDPEAELNLTIAGPVRDALDLIDHEPLGFASALNVDPAKTSGQSSTRLTMAFPLLNDLKLEQIAVRAESAMTDVRIGGVLLDQDVKRGRLDLTVDKVGMDVVGEVEWADIPARLAWRENFDDDAEFRSRFDLAAFVGQVERSVPLGFDLAPIPGEFIRGALGAEVHYTVFTDDKARLEAKADLADLSLAFPALGWTKEAGVGGTAAVDVSLAGNAVTDIPYFAVTAGDLVVLGSVAYDDPGTVKRIDISRMSYGRTEVKGTAEPRPARDPGGAKGWAVAVTGSSFDMAPLWEEFTDNPDAQARKKPLDLDVDLSARLDRVWLGDGRFVTDLNGMLTRRGHLWTDVALTAKVVDDKTMAVDVVSDGAAGRRLHIASEDAGAALRTFELYDNMLGGKLEIGGYIDDSKSDSPMTGRISVEDYRIKDAPALAHLVSILALTGIVESLQGQGLSFTKMDIPFTYQNDLMTITDARAYGLSLGITASGTVSTKDEELDLTGTVVPAYAINTALNNVPLLGKLITGGEKGSGLFAANYTAKGPAAKPDIDVNPLSALAPGFLRNLFGILEGQTSVKPDGELVIPDSQADR